MRHGSFLLKAVNFMRHYMGIPSTMRKLKLNEEFGASIFKLYTERKRENIWARLSNTNEQPENWRFKQKGNRLTFNPGFNSGKDVIPGERKLCFIKIQIFRFDLTSKFGRELQEILGIPNFFLEQPKNPQYLWKIFISVIPQKWDVWKICMQRILMNFLGGRKTWV